MRNPMLASLLGVAIFLIFVSGCDNHSGPAKPAADMDEIQQYLAENPELNVDGLEEADEEVDLAEE